MRKDNRNLIIGIVVAVVVVIAIIIGIIVGNSAKPADDGGEPGPSEPTADYSMIDEIIGFGDYGAMEIQAKSIQNGEMTGKIVQIDGIVSHPMSKYSIVEEDENGNGIGTEFVIEGVDEDGYPQDGDHIIITGEIIEKEPLYFVIKTTPEYVSILETPEESE